MLLKALKEQLQRKSAKRICSMHGISDSQAAELITADFSMKFAKFRCIFTCLAKDTFLTSEKSLVNFSQLLSEITLGFLNNMNRTMYYSLNAFLNTAELSQLEFFKAITP